MFSLALRKLWRSCAAIFPATYYFTNKETALYLISFVLAIFIVIEIMRFYIKGFNSGLFVRLNRILQEKERNTPLTATYLLLSVFLTVILFTRDISITVLMFLVFGDAVASMAGKKFGRVRILSRTLEGSLAFFAACLAISFLVKLAGISLSWSVLVSGALIATVTELLSVAIDDNLTVALSSGIAMTILSNLSGS